MELAHLDYRQEWRLNWLSALLDDQNWYYKGRSEETREKRGGMKFSKVIGFSVKKYIYRLVH